MIVTTVTSPAHTVGAEGEGIRWRSLARRGMLHSECEAFDHVRLAPGTEFALRGRHATEQVWFALRGTGQVWFTPRGPGQLSHGPEDVAGHPVRAGDLVVADGESTQAVLRADAAGLDLLWLTVLPGAVIAALPARKPVIS